MAKGKAKPQEDFNEEEDGDDQPAKSRGKTGGVSNDKLGKVAKEVNALKQEAADINSDLGNVFKNFEEDGGHKMALKVALKIQRMETTKAQDFWRSLEAYMDGLGIFDQHDLFDPIEKKTQKAAPKVPSANFSTEASATH